MQVEVLHAKILVEVEVEMPVAIEQKLEVKV